MNFLKVTVALAACGAFLMPDRSHAQTGATDWPAGRTVKLIVPAPGGSGTGDALARLIADQLRDRLHMTLIVDNRPGANGIIGTAAAAKARPDGNALLFSWVGTLAVSPALNPAVGFDPQKSFEPIALVADVPNVLVVNQKVASTTFPEFVQLAKSQPGKLNFGSTGIGSSMHLAAELFMRETGTSLVHVPYSAAGQGMANLISNDIQSMFQLVPGAVGHVRNGRVRALAVMSETRSPAMPEVPTTAELGFPKLQAGSWFALLAPKGTPTAVLDKVNAEVNVILQDPEVRKHLTEMGATPLGGTRIQFATHLAAEVVKWSGLVKTANIKAE